MSNTTVKSYDYKVGDEVIFMEEYYKSNPTIYTSNHADAAKRQAILTIRKISKYGGSDSGKDSIYVTNDKGKDIRAYLLAHELKRAPGDWDV